MSVPAVRRSEETPEGYARIEPSPAPAPARRRLEFLDVLRGVAIILMILNHTSRDWIERSMGWGRYDLVYGSLLLPAPIFLFLVGFCLPLSYQGARAHSEPWLAMVVKFTRRGLQIVAAGLLLNVLLLDGRFWKGGVLQTIGLSIVLLAPLLPVVGRRAVRAGLVAVAVLIYVAFSLAYPALGLWSAEHPLIAEAVLLDFPPFPWISAALIGLVLGAMWLEARARGPRDERRFFAVAAVVGVVSVLGYLAWQWWASPSMAFGFTRDFSLNGHWTPRGATLFLVVGGVAALLAATYWLMEVRKVSAPWLVVLGQTALVLYFLHQLVEYTLVKELLGWRFTSWWLYGGANVVLLVLCFYLARGWLALKPWVKGRVLPARSDSRAMAR
jgi:uncharacterized membrane protein